MDKKRTTKEKKVRYFHEVIEEDEKILAVGLKQSRLHKKERLDREKNGQTNKISSTWSRL